MITYKLRILSENNVENSYTATVKAHGYIVDKDIYQFFKAHYNNSIFGNTKNLVAAYPIRYTIIEEVLREEEK